MIHTSSEAQRKVCDNIIVHKSKDEFINFMMLNSAPARETLKSIKCGSWGLDYDSIKPAELFRYIVKAVRCNVSGKIINTYASDVDAVALFLNVLSNTLFTGMSFPIENTEDFFVSDKIIDETIHKFSNELLDGPYEYSVSFPLPNLNYPSRGSINLSRDIVLETFCNSTFGSLLFSSLLSKQDKCMSIKFIKNGIIGAHKGSPLLEETMATFKQLLSLSYVLGITNVVNHHYFDLHKDIEKYTTHCYVTGHGSDGRKVPVHNILPYSLAMTYVSPGIERYLQSGVSGDDIQYMLDAIPLCMDTNDDHINSIKSSLFWLFDSIYSENPVTMFISTNLAIEAMVGGGIQSSCIKHVVSSRIAYANYKTRIERNRFISNYIEFYDIRSKIIHGSVTKLNNSQIELCYMVRDALIKLIKGELFARLSVNPPGRHTKD